MISNKALKWSLERFFFYRLMPETSSPYLWMTKKVDPIVFGDEQSDADRCFLEKYSRICLHSECSGYKLYCGTLRNQNDIFKYFM